MTSIYFLAQWNKRTGNELQFTFQIFSYEGLFMAFFSLFSNIFQAYQNLNKRNLEIRFALLHADAYPPVRKHAEDAGMDVFAYSDVLIPPHSFGIVPTGLLIQVPEGCMLDARPKSKSNFLLGAGVIDFGYQGEILIKVANISPEPLLIRRGEPVAQLVASQIIVAPLVEYPRGALFEQSSVRGADGGIARENSKNK